MKLTKKSILSIFLSLALLAGLILQSPSQLLLAEDTPTDSPAQTIQVEPTQEEAPPPESVAETGTETSPPADETGASVSEPLAVAPPSTDDPTPSAGVIPADQASPSAEMTTGDAYAAAETTSLTNTTLVDSVLDVELTDITATDAAQIDLFSSSATASATPSAAINTINNQASVNTSVTAVADTGNNNQSGPGDAAMQTGDAVASAMATSITNTSLVDSQLYLAVINIFTNWNGDIVLPSLDELLGELKGIDSGSATIFNSATVNTTSTAVAETGNNFQEGGNSSMVTGNALAVSSSTSVTNTTLYNTFLFQLIVNNLSLWTGQIYNFTAPGSRQDPASLLAITNMSAGETPQQVEVTNQANVTTSAVATATTGNNQQAANSASMQTGNAFASAVATDITNTSLISSRYFWGQINLFQPWSGNLIFAYPDLQVSVSAPDEVIEGEDIHWAVTVTNAGYAPASNVLAQHTIQNSGHEVAAGNQSLNELLPGQSVTQDIVFNTSGRAGHTIYLDISVLTDKIEESDANNSAHFETLVEPQPALVDDPAQNDGLSGQASGPAPQISLSVGNNIRNFVYAGDQVRYTTQIKNTGEVTIYDLIFHQDLLDPDGQVVTSINIPLPDLVSGKKLNLGFILSLGDDLPAGEYITESTISGSAVSGLVETSITNSVPIRAHLGAVFPGSATSFSTLQPALVPTVLGTQISAQNSAYGWYWAFLPFLTALHFGLKHIPRWVKLAAIIAFMFGASFFDRHPNFSLLPVSDSQIFNISQISVFDKYLPEWVTGRLRLIGWGTRIGKLSFAKLFIPSLTKISAWAAN